MRSCRRIIIRRSDEHTSYWVSGKKGPKAQAAFEALGYIAEGEWTHDEIRKVDILFLQKDGYRIELVSPYAPDSVVSGLIRTYKNAPYHLCYEAENFEKRAGRAGRKRLHPNRRADACSGHRRTQSSISHAPGGRYAGAFGRKVSLK